MSGKASTSTTGVESGQTPALLTKEELLGGLPDSAPEQRIDGPFGGSVIIRALVDNADFCRLIEKVDFRSKHKVPETADLPATTIEQITWLEFCCVEPKLSFDDCLLLSQRAGWWVFQTYITLQQMSGIRPEHLEAAVGALKEDPFASNTSAPASEG